MHPIRTERCRNIRGGIVPISPSFHCRRQNPIKNSPESTNSTITLTDLHGYEDPPHWSASSRQHTAPINVVAPKGSIFSSFVCIAWLRSSFFVWCNFKKTRIKKRSTAPIGTLLDSVQLEVPSLWESCTYIQKHHLQVTSFVRAPPNIGPKQAASPKALTTIPRKRGRFSSGTESAIMQRAPWKSPAAPMPATTLPRIKVDEFGAAAQSTEPTKSRDRLVRYRAEASCGFPSKIMIETM